MQSEIESCVEEFLLYLESVRTLSHNTVIAYKNDLSQFLVLLGEKKKLLEVNAEDIRFCIASFSKQKKASTSINRFISAVKNFFSYCKKFGYIKINPCLEIKSLKSPKHLPEFLTGREVDELCAEPEVKPLLWQSRDKAMFEVLYSSGCRIGELASLKKVDVDRDLKSAVVFGKGKKERKIFFSDEAQLALKLYLAERQKIFAEKKIADTAETLFVNKKGTALSSRGMRWILARYSGVEGTNHHVFPHEMRHTFASAMISRGADVRIVQELLGHASISTTQRYTHVTSEQLIALYNKAHPHGKK